MGTVTLDDPKFHRGGRKPQRESVRRMTAFAEAYAMPTSPTFRQMEASVRAVAPELTEKSVNNAGGRWLKEPLVLEIIARIEAAERATAAVTPAGYTAKALAYSEYLIKRGERGDAGAASRYYELAGKAAGLLVTRTEDLTPADRKFPPVDYTVMQLERIVASMRALQQPNPLPPASLKAPAEEAEFTIEPERPPP